MYKLIYAYTYIYDIDNSMYVFTAVYGTHRCMFIKFIIYHLVHIIFIYEHSFKVGLSIYLRIVIDIYSVAYV
jgi:hypothetical protein